MTSGGYEFTSFGTGISVSYFLRRFQLSLGKIFTEEFLATARNEQQPPKLESFRHPVFALDCKCQQSARNHFLKASTIITFMDLVRGVSVTPAQIEYAKLYFGNLLTRMRKKFKATTIVGGPDDGTDLAIQEDLVVDYETGVLSRSPCAPKIGPCHYSRDYCRWPFVQRCES